MYQKYINNFSNDSESVLQQITMNAMVAYSWPVATGTRAPEFIFVQDYLDYKLAAVEGQLVVML